MVKRMVVKALLTTFVASVFSFGSAAAQIMGELPKQPNYGADISFPMQHAWISIDGASSLDSMKVSDDVDPSWFSKRKSFYQGFMLGCAANADWNTCEREENGRIDSNLRQPPSVRNYTSQGFAKIKAPKAVYQLIRDFWDRNRNQNQTETWPSDAIYVNHWDVVPEFVDLYDDTLDGGGQDLAQQIWDAARDTIQQWTQQRLQEVSLYGVRVYKEGAILTSHVDRFPLVSSAIINVDQDVDEPWPLEVIGHDGKAHNVTMEPGDLVLYESHSIIHGRPFALKGRFYANVFVHFAPVGPLDEDADLNQEREGTATLPPYIIEGSDAVAMWEEVVEDEEKEEKERQREIARNIRRTVTDGNLDELVETMDAVTDKEIIQEILSDVDENGFSLLHEAVRDPSEFGIVEYLIGKGADVNLRTHFGEGYSVLWLALDELGDVHEVVELLRHHEAEKIAASFEMDDGNEPEL